MLPAWVAPFLLPAEVAAWGAASAPWAAVFSEWRREHSRLGRDAALRRRAFEARQRSLQPALFAQGRFSEMDPEALRELRAEQQRRNGPPGFVPAKRL